MLPATSSPRRSSPIGYCLAWIACAILAAHCCPASASPTVFTADNRNIQYGGRVDFSDRSQPRFWAPGVTIDARFAGTSCEILLNDQVLWGNYHNYIEVVIDGGEPRRLQTTGKVNDIVVATDLAPGPHSLRICKDTESGIGYLELTGIKCDALLPPLPEPDRKIEFIGDSITCGFGSDQRTVPCGKGAWYDQQNAYLSYGPTTARALGAQWMVTAVSGIGLIHSWCNMQFVMPQVYGQTTDRPDGPKWDTNRFKPDIVTICLGQNDGEVDSKVFDDAYVRFIETIRRDYPNAVIVCLGSPMADTQLRSYQQENLTRIVSDLNDSGDWNVHDFFFSRQFGGGCGGHPDLESQKSMAAELTAYVRALMHW